MHGVMAKDVFIVDKAYDGFWLMAMNGRTIGAIPATLCAAASASA
jgi:hypothetical protein